MLCPQPCFGHSINKTKTGYKKRVAFFFKKRVAFFFKKRVAFFFKKRVAFFSTPFKNKTHLTIKPI